MKKSELRKLVKEEIKRVLKEGTYENFISNHGREIKSLSHDFNKWSKKLNSLPEKDFDDIISNIEKNLKMYDKINYEFAIESLIAGSIDVRDAAKVAVDMQNRFGTETGEVYNALEDIAQYIRRERKLK